MELHYPSAYSTPTTLNNSQENNNSAITTTTITNSSTTITLDNSSIEKTNQDPNLFDYKLKITHPVGYSKLPSSQNIHLKYENGINSLEKGLNFLYAHETEDLKPVDILEISPQFCFSESSSSIEPNSNTTGCNISNESTSSYLEQNTNTDWFSQLFYTPSETTSYETTLSKTCISPSWKSHEYIHYSYMNCSPDVDIQPEKQSQQQQHHQQTNKQSTIELLQGVQFGGDYEAPDKPSINLFENVTQNSQYYNTIKTIENIDPMSVMNSDIDSNQSALNLEHYKESTHNSTLPGCNITDGIELSNHFQSKLEHNTDFIKLHQYYPVNYNEQIFPFTPKTNSQSNIIQTNVYPNLNSCHTTTGEHFQCQLCSLQNNSPSVISNSVFDPVGMKSYWANYCQTVHDNADFMRGNHRHNNNFQQNSSPQLSLSFSQVHHQGINDKGDI
ncbi:unnamed protein product [Heterobilharzia americana]|nr:unnamed protein product [Heterobilharzia americana]